VVEVGDLGGHPHQRRRIRREHVDRVGDVLLRRVALVADEPARFVQHAIGHREFAEVVDARGLRELRAFDLREAHARADRFGIERDAPAVIARARIAHVEQLRERVERRSFDREHRFVERLLIGVGRPRFRHRVEARAAQRDQIARERDERDRIDRLVQERRRAALERLAREFFVGRAGDHHDRRVREPASAHFADEVEPAEFGHVLIDDDQRRVVGGTPGQRVARRREADRFGLGNLGDDLREHGQVQLDVVDDEDLGQGVGGVGHVTLSRYAATATRSRS